MANFIKARKEIEPFDDINDLRKTSIDDRLTNLREKIYKNRKPVVVTPKKKPD